MTIKKKSIQFLRTEKLLICGFFLSIFYQKIIVVVQKSAFLMPFLDLKSTFFEWKKSFF